MPGLIDPNWKGNALDASPLGVVGAAESELTGGGLEIGALGTALVLLCAADDSDGLAVAFVTDASDPP
jgi:hypothetical protein